MIRITRLELERPEYRYSGDSVPYYDGLVTLSISLQCTEAEAARIADLMRAQYGEPASGRHALPAAAESPRLPEPIIYDAVEEP